MSSIAFTAVREAFEALSEHADESTDRWSTAQRYKQLERIETLRRMLPALEHELINQLEAHATAEELGGSLSKSIANRLRITRGEAARRIAEAADLGGRRTLTGEPLPAHLEYTAAGQRRGLVGAEHVKVIRGFFERLPACVDACAQASAERRLAKLAAKFRPDQLRKLADRLDLCLNPDGNFTDADRARRRGVTLGPQGADGTSRISGYVSAELRVGLDAVIAKWGAPGMCNPADQMPAVTGSPSEEAIKGDDRTAAMRIHDAINVMVRSTLMSGELGSHHGLPVTMIVTAKLEDLQANTGVAHTAGGTLLPMSDAIRLAAHSSNYLLVFDKAKRCELFKGRDRRLATKEQRLVLYATERGCSHPGCDVPAYWCEVHHATADWAKGGQTNIDDLTLACGPDNRLVKDGGWTTRKNEKGETEWIPPPHLDRGQPRRNDFHHPERLLDEDDGDDAR
ncbi:MAG: hypothetical protein QOH57_3497 [Mycobacterium sp.]|nr:hypothetical protein [Mycobacterium sp.]